MKVLRYANGNMVVRHFLGVPIPMPGWVRWVAVASNGVLFGYETKPTLVENLGWKQRGLGTYTLLAEVDLEGMAWERTLMEVPHVP